MFKPGDWIKNKNKKSSVTIHEVESYNPLTGVINVIIRFGNATGKRRQLTRPENYKKVKK